MTSQKEIKANQTDAQKAIIYCRVSSQKQVTEGDGLNSQERRCSEYAKCNNLLAVKTFRDEGISGGGDFIKRPAMVELLKFLDENPTESFVIIFDDLKRFARDTVFHFKLKKELSVRQAIPKCLNFNFEDSPEGEFIETIIAAHGQLELQQNKRQVCQKQKARLENGYWTFFQPLGYHYELQPLHGKILVPTPGEADIVKEGLELFARGIFDTKRDVGRFWDKKGLKPRRTTKFCDSTVERALTQFLYTGEMEYPDWGVERRNGQHKSIISLSTFEAIQDRLNGVARPRVRIDVNKDFPLRGYVSCSCCGKPITGSWNKGSTKSYANYHCRSSKKICSFGGKIINKEKLETQYQGILNSAKPAPQVLDLTKKVMLDCWNNRINNLGGEIKRLRISLTKIEQNKESATDQYLSANKDSLKDAIAQKIESLDTEQKELEKKIDKLKKTEEKTNFKEALELVFNFLENPEIMWSNGDFELKQLVQRLVFTRPVSFNRDEGFGTAEKALPYSVSDVLDNSNVGLVEVARVELASKEDMNFRLRVSSLVCYLFCCKTKQNTEQVGLSVPIETASL